MKESRVKISLTLTSKCSSTRMWGSMTGKPTNSALCNYPAVTANHSSLRMIFITLHIFNQWTTILNLLHHSLKVVTICPPSSINKMKVWSWKMKTRSFKSWSQNKRWSIQVVLLLKVLFFKINICRLWTQMFSQLKSWIWTLILALKNTWTCRSHRGTFTPIRLARNLFRPNMWLILLVWHFLQLKGPIQARKNVRQEI